MTTDRSGKAADDRKLAGGAGAILAGTHSVCLAILLACPSESESAGGRTDQFGRSSGCEGEAVWTCFLSVLRVPRGL